ncbi:hypothetical protein NDU88_005706 [Pleurodeles waltl]|uniref:Uncharacterized protein n=1 Tax=Pleurodeles waltl TaxID=8319 RepID=A0AAV7WBS5_PLEWA|nr:hypothetical protein NDU88_005706 [Pleurodeles waltl]
MSRVPCHLMAQRAKPRTGAPNPGPAGAPEPKLTGESSLGPRDSQAWAPEVKTGWRKGVPVPGTSGGPAGAPEPKLAVEASPGPVDSQAWAPQCTEGWRKGEPVLGPSRDSMNTATQGRSPWSPSQVPCHMAGWRTTPRMGVTKPGPARDRAPELDPEGEAFPGPEVSQASTAQGLEERPIRLQAGRTTGGPQSGSAQAVAVPSPRKTGPQGDPE